MRFLLYNIRYATGTGPAFHLPLPGAGYLRSSARILDDITQFLRAQDPDIVGLLEVDSPPGAGTRLQITLPPGQALAGQLTRDWVNPVLGGGRS